MVHLQSGKLVTTYSPIITCIGSILFRTQFCFQVTYRQRFIWKYTVVTKTVDCNVLHRFTESELIFRKDNAISMLQSDLKHQLLHGSLLKSLTIALADLEGACPAHAPLRVQILSFRHTKFAKRNRLGSPHPPLRDPRPLWKSWIRHCIVNLHIIINAVNPIGLLSVKSISKT